MGGADGEGRSGERAELWLRLEMGAEGEGAPAPPLPVLGCAS